ncbi:MAG: hypothetical protein ACI8Z9_001208 [Paraglaciecola sp.]|jgi:hypothetical protein
MSLQLAALLAALTPPNHLVVLSLWGWIPLPFNGHAHAPCFRLVFACKIRLLPGQYEETALVIYRAQHVMTGKSMGKNATVIANENQ